MQRYDLMTYSGVMHEWKRRTMRGCRYQFDPDLMPKDKSWQVILLFAALVAGFAVMVVRWWLCV